MSRTIRLLHVDDDPEFAELTAEFLTREKDCFTVRTATSAAAAMDHLNTQPIDCIVSDYDMQEQDGLEFLQNVRQEWPKLPFILFTGKGSEEVASEAISAGATDYLQKGGRRDSYELLANRIENAVSQYRSEKQLRRTTQEYATVFESALTGLLLIDVESNGFRYQRCNPRAIELIGRDREEIVGSTPSEIFGPEDGRKVRGAYRKCIERGEPLEYTITLNLPTGQVTRPGKVVPVTSEGDIEQLVLSFYDITGEKRRQEQLERRNDLFDKAQNIADVGAWEYDVQEDKTTWTDQVYDIHGCPKDFTPDNTTVIEFYHPDDRPTLREAFRNAIENGDPYDLELRLQLPGGETRWVSVRGQPQTEDGNVVRVRGAIQDITETKERVKEVVELKRQYQALSENIPNGAVFLFDSDLRYVRARGTELEAVGLTPDEIEGSTPHDVFPKDLADELARHFEDALNGHCNTFTQSLGDSTYRNRTVPVKNSEGNITHGIALAQNVTDQIERRDELKAQNERLGEFARVVSHDLRNPLQAAAGRLELARAECDSPHLESVADALARSEELIDDLLLLAQDGDSVNSMETVSVSAEAEACWKLIETDDAALVVDSDQTVSADRSRLRQLLENLFANAVEHGGRDLTVSVGSLPDGFYVTDDGVGIPEGQREDVFEPGYSTAEDGSGFGLQIVQRIVGDHGWNIEVTDSADGGTRIEVTGVDVSD